MVYGNYIENNLHYINKLNDILFICHYPCENIVHSPNINCVHAYYVALNDINLCLNNWAFLKKNECLSIDNIFESNKLINIEEEVYLIKHEVPNMGHSFINILYQISHYINNKYTCKIMINKKFVEVNNFMKSIIYLFFNPNNVILIEDKVLYKIKKIHMTLCGYLYDKYCCINLLENIKSSDGIGYIVYNTNDLRNTNTYIETFLTNKIKQCIQTQIYNHHNNTRYDKVCIIKSYKCINSSSEHMNNNQSIDRSFSEEYTDFFKNQGFLIINPAKYNCIELYQIFNNAKIIISSWGCISWINKSIIENNSLHYLLLSHVGYTYEFIGSTINNFSPICNKIALVYNLTYDFDKNTEKIISDALINLL